MYASFIHQSENNRVQALHWDAEACTGLRVAAGSVALWCVLGSCAPSRLRGLNCATASTGANKLLFVDSTLK